MKAIAKSAREVRPCSTCQEGVIAIGNAVQFCLCLTGRAKKREWFGFAEEYRLELEAPRFVVLDRHHTNTLIAVEPGIQVLPDLEDFTGAANLALDTPMEEEAESSKPADLTPGRPVRTKTSIPFL